MINLIKKALLYMKSEGIAKTIKKSFGNIYKEMRKIPNWVLQFIFKNKHIKELKEVIKDKRVIVIVPCIDWNTPIHQRPHQMAKAFSKQENTVVFFVSDEYLYDDICFKQKIDKNLYLYSIKSTRYLNEVSKGANEVIMIMAWTRRFNLIYEIKYDKLVYEYIDELSLFYYYNEDMEMKHRLLLKTADLTLATADKLYKNAEKYAKRIILSENAVDYDFFSKSKNCEVNDLIKDKIKNYECVLGYYGCLASWFDYQLINSVAKIKKNWLFVIIGYDFDGTYKNLDLGCENILYLPPQPYETLPTFLSGFDIALIPFVVNEITESTSPVKLFEYMAAGKPIVTSDMAECRKYKATNKYKNLDQFIYICENVILKKYDSEYYKTLEYESYNNSWMKRVEDIIINI